MSQEIRPRVFVAFECSGRVRSAFARRGWFAVSCDLKPTAIPCGPSEYHHIGNAFDLLDPEWLFGVGWDLMIAFPDCTFLAGSGMHWNRRTPGRSEKTEAALHDIRRLMRAKIPRKAIENPSGVISSRIRKPDQVIQPNRFGENASKGTCLWLYGLPPLVGTVFFPPRIVPGRVRTRFRWDNQTDSGQNKLGPSPERAAKRAETYNGIAAAMANQWGDPDKWPKTMFD